MQQQCCLPDYNVWKGIINSKVKIGVVYGGYSSESKASAENAKYIMEALQNRGYEVYPVPYQKGLVDRLRRLEIDVVYVCVQGKGHGDGTIQAVLEQEGIPFTGSGSHGATIINDKILSKMFFERAQIQTPRWQILTYEEYRQGSFDGAAFGYPFVAKAPSEGGSFGIELIQGAEQLEKLEQVFAYESLILIEQFIAGDFYTIPLLEHHGEIETLPCIKGIEVEESVDKMDIQSLKLFTGEYRCEPADLPKELISRMKHMAIKVYKTVGARDIARVDFMVDVSTMQPYVLEVNAVPGLKPRSLFPGAAKIAGMAYEDLIENLLLEAKSRINQEDEKC